MVLAAVVVLAAAPTPATGPTATQAFRIAPGHVVELTLPPEWHATSKKRGDLEDVTIKPRIGKAFDVSVFPMFYRREDTQLSDEDEIVAYLQFMAVSLSANAVEPKATINRMRLDGGVGHYFCFTDKRESPPGEGFRNLCHAFVVLGDLRLSVTLRMKEPDKDLFNRLMAMLQAMNRRNS